jgi:hypothetical protein
MKPKKDIPEMDVQSLYVKSDLSVMTMKTGVAIGTSGWLKIKR